MHTEAHTNTHTRPLLHRDAMIKLWSRRMDAVGQLRCMQEPVEKQTLTRLVSKAMQLHNNPTM